MPEASNKTNGETLDVATCVNVRIPAMPFIPSKTSMAMAVTAIMVAPALILMCMNKSVEGYTIFPKRERGWELRSSYGFSELLVMFAYDGQLKNKSTIKMTSYSLRQWRKSM